MPRLKSNPPTTAEVMFLRRAERGPFEAYIDWAISMLSTGHDSPSLRMLAGEPCPSAGVDYRLVDRTFAELGFELPDTLHEASVRFVTERVQLLLKEEVDMGRALHDLADQYRSFGFDPELQKFYLLNFAYADLQAHEDQHYWEGANSANIRSIVLAECTKWLAALPSTE